MKDVYALNGHVFFLEKTEARSMGSIELVTANDTDHRYSKGICYSAADDVPLDQGDVFLYEKSHAFDVYINGTMYKAVHAARILGKLNETTEQ